MHTARREGSVALRQLSLRVWTAHTLQHFHYLCFCKHPPFWEGEFRNLNQTRSIWWNVKRRRGETCVEGKGAGNSRSHHASTPTSFLGPSLCWPFLAPLWSGGAWGTSKSFSSYFLGAPSALPRCPAVHHTQSHRVASRLLDLLGAMAGDYGLYTSDNPRILGGPHPFLNLRKGILK